MARSPTEQKLGVLVVGEWQLKRVLRGKVKLREEERVGKPRGKEITVMLVLLAGVEVG